MLYDGTTRLAATGAPVIVVGADPSGGGILSSLVVPDEIRDRRGEPWPAAAGALRLVYAGRLADGKGLDALLEAVAILAGGSGEAGEGARRARRGRSGVAAVPAVRVMAASAPTPRAT